MGERCDVTELLADQCAHCKGVSLPELDPQRRDMARPPVVITAGYPGRCAACGELFPPGVTIAGTPDGWVANCCHEGDIDG